MPSVRKKRAQNKQNYLRNKENRREVARSKYWENPDKQRARRRASYWENPDKGRASSRVSSHTHYWEDPETKGHLPGHLLIHVIGKILRKEGQFPVYPPMLVIGGTLIRKGQQLA